MACSRCFQHGAYTVLYIPPELWGDIRSAWRLREDVPEDGPQT